VRIFCDTTVLVAGSVESHPHFAQARPVLLRIASGEDKGFAGLHSIAETFAALTRVPVRPRIHPVEAVRIIADNLIPNFETVSLDEDEYMEVAATVAEGGWSGAKIYDALLLRCAEKCAAERIYTFNLGDFQALATGATRSRVCAP
jgi:predicted nucleic acid-binding protein